MLELNKIYNQDCIKFMKQLPNECVDLIIADPPYFGIVKDDWDNQWEDEDAYLNWCKQWIIECERILKSNGSLYCWGGIGEKSDTIIKIKILIDKITKLKFKNWITWHKKRGIGNGHNWLYTREELLFYTKTNKYTFTKLYSNNSGTSNASKKKFKETGIGKRLSNVWDDILEMGWNNTGKCKMSAEKPVKLAERIIQASSNENNLIYIPFAGSGSEIEACIKNNRNWLATEIKYQYINEIIMPRIKSII